MSGASLPQWVEYVKALGTPTIALLAATAAGWVAHRQWITARNKLKLDFFDRRMEIYRLAVAMLQTVRKSHLADYSSIEKLESSLNSARWLFDPSMELFLNELALRCVGYMNERPSPGIGLSEDDLARALTSATEREECYQKERRLLDATFAPFLSLQH